MKTTRRTFMSGVAAAGAAGALPLISTRALAQEKTLRVRFYDDPAGFDPANVFRIENENIAFNLFSGLTTYDSQTGKIIPDLAESWETKDNINWVFKLRRGVQWHKGFGEVTSADVLYSFQRILDPATASPYRSELGGVVKMEAPDDYTVVIQLNAPDGNFLHTVANYHQGQIVNRKAIEAAGRQVRWQPVGTGPYYLDFDRRQFAHRAQAAQGLFPRSRADRNNHLPDHQGRVHGHHRAPTRRDRPQDAIQPRGEHCDAGQGRLRDEQGRQLRRRPESLQHEQQGVVRRARAPRPRPRRRLRIHHQGDLAHAAGAGAFDAHAVDGRLYARRSALSLQRRARQEASGGGRLSEGLLVQEPEHVGPGRHRVPAIRDRLPQPDRRQDGDGARRYAHLQPAPQQWRLRRDDAAPARRQSGHDPVQFPRPRQHPPEGAERRAIQQSEGHRTPARGEGGSRAGKAQGDVYAAPADRA